MNNVYSVKRNGEVVGSGTYQTLKLLQMDYPSPEYELVLGKILPLKGREDSYADLRRRSYPSASELGDALFWQSKGDNSRMEAYLAACEAVKLRYPKPE